MQAKAGSHDRPRPLREALIDYQRSPSQYQATLRQPATLFASVKEIIQLAIVREGATTPPGPPVDSATAQAARFFVRNALLYPNADPYALLGLEPGKADEAEVKNRYRLLMRLLHPDFSSGGPHWPADAAVRVNLAYAALSSPASVRDDNGARRSSSSRPAPPAPPPRPRRSPSVKEHGRHKPIVLATSFAVAVGLGTVIYFGGSPDLVELVQREPMMVAINEALAPNESVVAEPAVRGPDDLIPAAAAQMSAAPTEAGPTTPDKAMVAAAPAPPVQMDRPPLPVLVPPEPPATAAARPAEPSTALPVATAVAAAAPPPPQPARPPFAAAPGVTMADAHPLLARLLQHMESGNSDKILTVLEPAARATPSAQAVLRHYNSLFDGGQPLKLSHVQFKAEPREGRLLVTGHILMRVDEQPENAGKAFSMQAEFALKDGAVVMTRLARAQN